MAVTNGPAVCTTRLTGLVATYAVTEHNSDSGQYGDSTSNTVLQTVLLSLLGGL